MIMTYEQFDSGVGMSEYKYGEIQEKILIVLKTNPLNVYELNEEIKCSLFILSSQLQFLKRKGKVINKKFQGICYWALPKESREVFK